MANGNPDFEQMVQQFFLRLQEKWRRRKKGGSHGGSHTTLIIIALLLWLATGIYVVSPDQQGVVIRFGEAVYTTSPGPHWHLPWPIERVEKPRVKEVKKIEVGFRTISQGPPAKYVNIPNESLMLTGDENIVDLEFIIQFEIKDPIEYLFNVRRPNETLKDAAESAMREVIGRKQIDDALTTGKSDIQKQAHELLQQILDSYKAGIRVRTVKLQDVDPPPEVNDAFKDVINAQQDKERAIYEAKGYENDLLPKARGFAAQAINEAEAYKETLIKNAEGEAQRFNELYKEYRLAKVVTRKRLYLETMEKILPAADKIILDESVNKNVLPYLPLNEIGKNKPRSQAASPRRGGQQ